MQAFTRQCFIISVFLSLIIPCKTSIARDVSVESLHWRINKHHVHLEINSDLTNNWEIEDEFEALTFQGASDIGQYIAPYNHDLETLEIISAYTLKKDGRLLSVNLSDIQIQTGNVVNAFDQNWQNVNTVKIIFPDVQRGDRTYIKLKGSEKKLSLPGWMRRTEYLNPAYTWSDFSYTVLGPKNLKINVFASSLSVKETQENENRIKWEITGSAPSKVLDLSLVNWQSGVPRVLVSSYFLHEQFGDSFYLENNKKILITPELIDLANNITKNRFDELGKAKAIYDWISENIRYSANYIGDGGYVAHDVADILKLRYGDCKDYNLLFQTLLKSVNIESESALLNSLGNQFELPEVPIGFDHVITYIPALNVFADSTAGNIPFGKLPLYDSDRPVVVTRESGSVLMRTPFLSSSENTIDSHSVWRIGKSGLTKLDLNVKATGYASLNLQRVLSNVPDLSQDALIKTLLNDSKLSGVGEVYFGALQSNKLSQNLKVSADIKNLMPDLDGGSISSNPALELPIYVSTSLKTKSTSAETRFSGLCTPVTVRESFEMTFDPTFKIVKFPKNFEIKEKHGISFDAKYFMSRNLIKGVRVLKINSSSLACDSEKYASRVDAVDLIVRHLDNPILYIKKF